MINKSINQITIDDFKDLIEHSVPESRTLEYKSEMKIQKGDDRKEFLADVSSFANSIGGDLIFGIAENENHEPETLCGIDCEDSDELIRKIESLIRDSIAPRISGIDIREYNLTVGKIVLLLRIKQSYLAPHRVVYQGHDKFYSRSSKGKYPMDVNDLRVAFNMAQTVSDKVEVFVSKRCAILAENQYDTFEPDCPLFVMHVIPLSSFSYNNARSISQIKDAIIRSGSGVFNSSYRQTYNADGVFQYANRNCNSSTKNYACAQYFRNGIIEAVTANFFNPSFEPRVSPPAGKIKKIYDKELVQNVIDSLNNYRRYLKMLDISAPIVLSVSMINVFEFTIINSWADVMGKIDRQMLRFPIEMLNSETDKTEAILKPIFDDIWNACGYERCSAYDENGNYIGLR